MCITPDEEENNDNNYVLEDQEPMDLTSKNVADFNHHHTIHHQNSQVTGACPRAYPDNALLTKATIVLSVPNVDLRSTTASTTTNTKHERKIPDRQNPQVNVIKTEKAKDTSSIISAGSNHGRFPANNQ